MKKNILMCAALIALGIVGVSEEVKAEGTEVASVYYDDRDESRHEDYLDNEERIEDILERQDATEEEKAKKWRFRSGVDYKGRPGLDITSEGDERRLPGDFDHGVKHRYEMTMARIGYEHNGWTVDYAYKRLWHRNYQGDTFGGKENYKGQSRTDKRHNLYITKDLGDYDFLGREWNLNNVFGFVAIEEGNVYNQDGTNMHKGFSPQIRLSWHLYATTNITDRLRFKVENILMYREYDENDQLNSEGEWVNTPTAFQVRNYFDTRFNYAITENLDFLFRNQIFYRSTRGSDSSGSGAANVDERWEWDYDYYLTHTHKLTDELSLQTRAGVWGEYQFARKGASRNSHDKGEMTFMPSLVYNTKINDVAFNMYGGVGYLRGFDTHSWSTTGYSGIEIRTGAGIDYRF